MTTPIFNFRRRKVGGIWFVRLGRFQLSFCLCRSLAAESVVANADL